MSQDKSTKIGEVSRRKTTDFFFSFQIAAPKPTEYRTLFRPFTSTELAKLKNLYDFSHTDLRTFSEP